jgi:hypothetical protein
MRTHMRKQSWRRLLAGLLVAALAAGIAAVAAAQGPGDGSGGHPAGGVAGPPLPPQKQAILDRIAQFKAALPNDPAAKAAAIAHNPGPPAATAETPPLNGILDTSQAPFAPGRYLIENRWQELRGATLHQLYAGADASDPSQGVVVEQLILWPDDRDLTVAEFRTPVKAGALKVTSVEGHLATLTSANGTQFVFDLAANRFVSP